MLLLAMNHLSKVQHGSFKFHNSIFDVMGFQDVVIQNWNLLSSGTPMCILWHKLMRLRKTLKTIHKPITSVQLNLARARHGLKNIQNELMSLRFDMDLIEKAKNLTEEVIHWNDMEEKIML